MLKHHRTRAFINKTIFYKNLGYCFEHIKSRVLMQIK